MPTNAIDPKTYGEQGLDYERGEMIGKIIIDATKPVTQPYATKITPSKALWNTLKIEDYF